MLINDLYPFLRFGMFAEPVKAIKKHESFIITFSDKSGKHIWDFKKAGLPTQPEYLLRNYYYRHESQLLLQKIAQIDQKTGVEAWELQKIENNDTTSVAVYRPAL